MPPTQNRQNPQTLHHHLPPSHSHSHPRNHNHNRNKPPTDTPRSFTNLLARRTHLTQRRRVRKPPSAPAPSAATPRIEPRERLADFAARVDAHLPLAKQRHGDKPLQIGGKTIKPPQTRTEKRMQRMQAVWRAEAAKRREKAEEAADEREVEEVGREGYSVKEEVDNGPGRKKKKKKKGGRQEEDPWKVLEQRRGKVTFGDVVQRPPELGKWRGKLKVRDGAGV